MRELIAAGVDTEREPSSVGRDSIPSPGVTGVLFDWLRRHNRERDNRHAAALVECAISLLDELLSEQVNEILHHPTFQRLESCWRGLRYLVDRAAEDAGRSVRIRVLDVRWRELARDGARALEFDQTALFQKVYEGEFGMAGGEPFSVLLGDYEIRPKPSADDPTDDLEVLSMISQTAAAAFAPFIAGAHPSLVGVENFGQLERHIDLERLYQSPDFAKWHALRRTEDSRFLGLALPRVLMRLPHPGSEAQSIERFCSGCGATLRSLRRGVCSTCQRPFDREDWSTHRREVLAFRFEEDVTKPDRSAYLWGNAAFAFAGVLIRAFLDCAWLADIRGFDRNVEHGGLVTGLPVHHFGTDAPGVAPKMSTEVVIDDDQEKSTAAHGLIPLSHCHDTEFCVFYSNSSVQRPQTYTDERATMNARLSAMLQYTLCVSRFAHYLKVLARERIGATAEPRELENRLKDWINEYVTQDDLASPDQKAKYPLREAAVSVRETGPGVNQLVMHLRPHYQLDDLRVSVRLLSRVDAVRR